MINDRRKITSKAKRLVLKIGSGLVTTDRGINTRFFTRLALQIQKLKKRGVKVTLVSSGAIGSGMLHLKLKERPSRIEKKQAVAAIGQPLLMHTYAKTFHRHGLDVAQILLTRENMENQKQFMNAKHALTEIFRYDVVAIINENDSVAVEEIQFGDNDQLSALVAHLVDADLLLILTDIDGVYDDDPKKNKKARRLSVIKHVDDKVLKLAKGTKSARSTGGMITKLKAAKQAAHFGIPTWILKGSNPQILDRVMQGEDVGTLLMV